MALPRSRRSRISPAPPRSLVSLVPSLTEALFVMGLSDRIAGRTKYCVEPAGLVGSTPVVGGTKNPDVERIISLRPDLVIASAEENVRDHVERLIDAGLTVYVSLPTTVRRAIAERLVISPGAVEKHIGNIFAKIDLADAGADNRRVLAVLAWLKRR